jgi:protein gp37
MIMSAGTGIQWTDATWNCLTGCTMVSPGCANCYAEKMSKRQQAMARADIEAGRNAGKKANYLDVINDAGRWSGKVNCDEQSLLIPLGWRKPRRVFVNSMSDLFHDQVPTRFIARVFAVMGLASWHTFQVLTKRPERMARLLGDEAFQNEIIDVQGDFSDFADDAAQRYGLVNVYERLKSDWRAEDHETLPLRNVWLGTSVENQKCADERTEHLRRCPAAVRFLSQEPQLEAITHRNLDGIHWVIVGGESGPSARPFDVAWARSIIQQGKAAGTAVFCKQLGAKVIDNNTTSASHFEAEQCWPDGTRTDYHGVLLKDSHGGDMAEWPEDLRVREFPGMAG